MKKKFDFEQVLNDWVWPLLILALIIWGVIWLSGGAKTKNEKVGPTPTPEQVIIRMRG